MSGARRGWRWVGLASAVLLVLASCARDTEPEGETRLDVDEACPGGDECVVAGRHIVVDENGDIVRRRDPVGIQDEDGELLATATTDAEGTFLFDPLPTDTVREVLQPGAPELCVVEDGGCTPTFGPQADQPCPLPPWSSTDCFVVSVQEDAGADDDQRRGHLLFLALAESAPDPPELTQQCWEEPPTEDDECPVLLQVLEFEDGEWALAADIPIGVKDGRTVTTDASGEARFAADPTLISTLESISIPWLLPPDQGEQPEAAAWPDGFDYCTLPSDPPPPLTPMEEEDVCMVVPELRVADDGDIGIGAAYMVFYGVEEVEGTPVPESPTPSPRETPTAEPTPTPSPTPAPTPSPTPTPSPIVPPEPTPPGEGM